jgi:hypothetical protein
MRIWFAYGSEHSSNLVMIGHFKSAPAAKQAQAAISAITEQAYQDRDNNRFDAGSPPADYGRDMLDVLGKINVSTITPHELEQFLYEVDVNVEGSDVVVTTEEYDLSGFMKALLAHGARVEVYSAHEYPDTKHGRGHKQ